MSEYCTQCGGYTSCPHQEEEEETPKKMWVPPSRLSTEDLCASDNVEEKEEEEGEVQLTLDLYWGELGLRESDLPG